MLETFRAKLEAENVINRQLKNGRLPEHYLKVPHQMTQDKAKSESLAKEKILKRSLTEPENIVKKS